jgi:hypothetical protein
MPNLVWLLDHTIFMLTYAGVSTKAHGEISPDYCVTITLEHKGQCQMSWCAPDCYEEAHGSGECVNKICMCTFCYYDPPIESPK